jgi:hypothetical protein
MGEVNILSNNLIYCRVMHKIRDPESEQLSPFQPKDDNTVEEKDI